MYDLICYKTLNYLWQSTWKGRKLSAESRVKTAYSQLFYHPHTLQCTTNLISERRVRDPVKCLWWSILGKWLTVKVAKYFCRKSLSWMFDSIPEYFCGILLKQNSMKFQNINALFAKLMNQVTYVSLSKWTQYINIRWIFAMFDQYLLFHKLVARHFNKVFFLQIKINRWCNTFLKFSNIYRKCFI